MGAAFRREEMMSSASQSRFEYGVGCTPGPLMATRPPSSPCSTSNQSLPPGPPISSISTGTSSSPAPDFCPHGEVRCRATRPPPSITQKSSFGGVVIRKYSSGQDRGSDATESGSNGRENDGKLESRMPSRRTELRPELSSKQSSPTEQSGT